MRVTRTQLTISGFAVMLSTVIVLIATPYFVPFLVGYPIGLIAASIGLLQDEPTENEKEAR